MSFVVAAPEAVASAAGNLAGIGATVEEATAAAAAPTTSVAAAAADEVSIAISQLFATHGREFQAISTRVATFQADFVRLLHGGASAYVEAEITNARQNLVAAVNAPARAPLGQLLQGGVSALTNGRAASVVSDQIGAGAKAVSRIVADGPRLQALETALSPGLLSPAAASVPGGAYARLFSNTATNLAALNNAWAANPFPFLRQVLANQQVYWQEIAATIGSAIQNFPANLVNLPAAIEAAVQQLLTFDAAFYAAQFIHTQIGFAQTFATTLNSAVTGIEAGLPAFEVGVETAFQTALAGDYNAAVAIFGQATADLLVTGFDTSDVTISTPGNNSIVATANPKLLGPLGDLFTLMAIPGQEAQYFTDLMPPSILRQMSQNLTDVLNVLTNPSISATLFIPPPLNFPAGTLSAFFGLPLMLTYSAAGAPFATLNALADSATAIQEPLIAGNGMAALSALIDAPAVVADGFLNGQAAIDMPIQVPTGLPGPLLPTEILIVLNLRFDGILVPPHPVTGTVSFPGYIIFPGPIEVTVFGTPFMGLVPLLVNYLPQQLATTITPAP
ncbi:PE family protein [Mycobacterium spongiae]|uniref:PE domain-containing protein n=1 Tax=Mycobacterium spongiae TaxID=886343 RepID=A0A975K107_9MYCO|nr:PE family protein [Mycobacterium spongiae]QUR69384.1 PE domain-containing protein [Mycobacterium spongiae]